MTTTNQNTAARRAELRCKVAELATIYRANSREVVKTSGYTYADLQWNDDLDCLMFVRNGERICVVCALPDGKGYNLHNYDNPHHRVYFGRLPKFFQELIRYQMVILGNIRAREAEIDALDAEENEELPPPPAVIIIPNDAPVVESEELEPYSYAAALRSTLAERVTERAQMAAGELPPFTPETMDECDRDLIDDINAALEEIDADDVNALLKDAESYEKYDRPAKAHCYREVAQLAALYAINDAIESQPELEDLLSALFDWSNPVQLPENIAAGVADALAMAREVFSVSLLSPNDLSERSRCWSTDNWSDVTEFFRPADDDRVSAFSLNPNCGVWISYFNSVWIFEADYVTDAIAGSFESQTRQFVETLSRYLGPDAEDL